MSKLDYKKDIMDSLKEGTIVTRVTITGYTTLNYFFKIFTPGAKPDINNVVKLSLGIISGVLGKNYAVEQKWINSL